MSHIHIRSSAEVGQVQEDLASAARFALDCEAAGFHRYSDRLCLVQLTVGPRTYVIDPLAFDISDLLRGPLEGTEPRVVMHGADFDLRLLSRDLGIRLRGLVDTQIYAALAGEKSLGLQSLLESRLGVTLSKKYQRADWAERPLSDAMLAYAANDTRYLEQLVDLLGEELDALGRRAWAEEECRALETVADEPQDEGEPEDPVVRVKGARDLSPRQVTALREALAWRDEIAQEKDRALFRVVGDKPLVEAVARRPRRAEELREIRGFPKDLARTHGKDLVKRLNAVADLPDDALVPYPRGVRTGPGRPLPEEEVLIERIKSVRNATAKALDLPRGTVLANAVIAGIARAAPSSFDELLEVDGMRRWKVELLGERVLEAVGRN
jgi:ribonuclease D